MLYFLCFVLFSVGLYCVIAKRNIMKIIIGIAIMEYAVNLFFVISGYVWKGRAPIFAPDQRVLRMCDPLPQAVVLTSIVIGLGLLSLLAAIAMRLYQKYGTFDISKMRKLRG